MIVEVDRGDVSLQLNEEGVRRRVLLSGVAFQEVLLIRICIVNVHNKMGAMKYLGQNCYHRIKCFVVNSLAALMRK